MTAETGGLFRFDTPNKYVDFICCSAWSLPSCSNNKVRNQPCATPIRHIDLKSPCAT
jgi:hypothetical protein